VELETGLDGSVGAGVGLGVGGGVGGSTPGALWSTYKSLLGDCGTGGMPLILLEVAFEIRFADTLYASKVGF